MVVSGTLDLHGNAPATTYSHLTQTAFAGESVISVGAMTDWAVGDTLVISPSFSSA